MSDPKPSPPTQEDEDALDESLDESFPASDPPSQTDPAHTGTGTKPA
jgi:L-lactate dehydrogenase complex protein LldG